MSIVEADDDDGADARSTSMRESSLRSAAQRAGWQMSCAPTRAGHLYALHRGERRIYCSDLAGVAGVLAEERPPREKRRSTSWWRR